MAFLSSASNLVKGDTNDRGDFFVRDRVTGRTERVSVTSRGQQVDTEAEDAPAISASGRYIAFSSTAPDLDPLNRPGNDIFVRDRRTKRTELVSIEFGSGGDACDPAISADGRFVVYRAAPADTFTTLKEVYVSDGPGRSTQQLTRGSVIHPPYICADGSHVAFAHQFFRGSDEQIDALVRDADGDRAQR